MAVETTLDILKKLYPPRNPEVRKYDSGFVLVIGGSEFYSGAPAMAALSAFRAGADMVQVVSPKRASDIIASFSPVLASYPLEGATLGKEHVAQMLLMLEGASSVSHGKHAAVVGGGLGRSEKTMEAVRDFLAQCEAPALIDADAIHAVASHKDLVQGKPFLLTPHAYEFSVLTGRKVEGLSPEERADLVREEAAKLGAAILLKGPVDVVSDGKDSALVRAGNAYMTPGGTGDVLAGTAGAMLARGASPFDAGQGSAYLVGKAGEEASSDLKDALIATDLLEKISEIIGKL